MPLTIGWGDILLRLVFASAAAALVGWDRGEHGKTAGMRTTLLVCLASAFAMIEVNLLLATRNKPPDTFIQLDLMRLPLGILSGMGFIGAGAIIRRGDMAVGVTTAATLWFVTVVGLCFGAGSIGLGVVATALGFVVLNAVKHLEQALPADHRATVEVTVEGDPPVKAALSGGQYTVLERGGAVSQEGEGRRELRYDVRWRAPMGEPGPLTFLDRLAATPGVVKFTWRIGAP
jgi:putative Mg2+ transporter-C (MgtC) family protein